MTEKLKVYIDPGHGGKDSGAVHEGIREADVVLLIGLRLAKLLDQRGCDVLMSRTGNTYPSLKGRVVQANRWPADIFVSLHVNADPDPDYKDMPVAKGEEIWINRRKGKQPSKGSKLLAECLAPGVDAVFPDHRFRGIKTTGGICVISESDMPAVLIELGFIDNTEELALL
ncbi:MAG: N-acetylmuramoyl-L-alanine amidase, partial [Thermodesulfobacteriota bacterium]